jgi:hypothetical protein
VAGRVVLDILMNSGASIIKVEVIQEECLQFSMCVSFVECHACEQKKPTNEKVVCCFRMSSHVKITCCRMNMPEDQNSQNVINVE